MQRTSYLSCELMIRPGVSARQPGRSLILYRDWSLYLTCLEENHVRHGDIFHNKTAEIFLPPCSGRFVGGTIPWWRPARFRCSRRTYSSLALRPERSSFNWRHFSPSCIACIKITTRKKNHACTMVYIPASHWNPSWTCRLRWRGAIPSTDFFPN